MSHILKTLQYRCTLCTALNANHGVSGHLYEVIEYFYYLRFFHNISTCIVIPYQLTQEQFERALRSKYDFSENEISEYLRNTIIANNINIIIANTIIFTDGSFFNCPRDCIESTSKVYSVIAKKKIMIRCNNSETLDKADVVLQDNRLYEDLPNSVHYIKKILFSKLKKIDCKVKDTAMLYLTTNCRYLTYNELLDVKGKYTYKNYIILSNKKDYRIPDGFTLYNVPCDNLFEKFNTYIYTHLSGTCSSFDCSPRFICECKYYNKEVIYDLNQIYLGLNVRKYDLETKGWQGLELTEGDDLIKYI